jgi:hypothetical protein
MVNAERVRHGSLMRACQALSETNEAQGHPFLLLYLQHLTEAVVALNTTLCGIEAALERHHDHFHA